MDGAVSLVQTYLRVNGYFTVTEFPLVEASEDGNYRTATDLDVLACRFPDAGQVLLTPGSLERPGPMLETDPSLDVPSGRVDMIVGEVKEAAAGFNQAGLREEVMAAALARFGCCEDEANARRLARTLVSKGIAATNHGHQVRLVAFGGTVERAARYLQIDLATVVRYLERYMRENWPALKSTQSKDDALAFLMLQEKIRRSGR